MAEASSIRAKPPRLREACPSEKDTGPLSVHVGGSGSEALRRASRPGAASVGVGVGVWVVGVGSDGDAEAVCGGAADDFCPSPGVEGAAECEAVEASWVAGEASVDAVPLMPHELSARAHRSGRVLHRTARGWGWETGRRCGPVGLRLLTRGHLSCGEGGARYRVAVRLHVGTGVQPLVIPLTRFDHMIYST